MFKNGYIEVETPVLELITGGADAKPFITHHNDLGIDLFMRISTELNQKRLIGGGFEKIFTLGPNFRNEGVDDEHLQEYSSLEWYWAYANYEENMNFVKELFRFVASEVYGRTTFTSRGHTYDLASEWQVIDYAKVIKEKLNIDIFNSTEKEMLNVIKEKKVELNGTINKNRLIDNLWKIIRKDISGPAFLINEPKFMSPLAKSKPENNELTERFHIIIAGSELGNGYSEINDPIDQLERFKEQEKARLEGDAESQMLDIDFVEMLEYGMPPTSGFGMSERIFWFFEDCNAREGTLFPLMRPEIENITKEIYPDLFLTNKIEN
jgi:lysyl-tRNA synthetase class 2